MALSFDLDFLHSPAHVFHCIDCVLAQNRTGRYLIATPCITYVNTASP